MTLARDTGDFGRFGDNKNLLINGNFEIWQRGTSQTQALLGFQSADRWGIDAAGHTFTASRQPFTAGQTDVPNNPEYYYLMNMSAGAATTDYIIGYQTIEDVRTANGETLTVSFWAMGSGVLEFGVGFTQKFGSGGSADVYVDGQKVVLSTSWQKFTLHFDIPSIAGKTIGTGHGLQIVLWFSAGSTYTTRSGGIGLQTGSISLAQIQVERGPTATPFVPRTIEQEFALCQRYFQGGIVHLYCYAINTAAVGYFQQFPVSMRTTPSFTLAHTAGSNVNGVPVLQAQRAFGVTITETATASTQVWFWVDYTADAEF